MAFTIFCILILIVAAAGGFLAYRYVQREKLIRHARKLSRFVCATPDVSEAIETALRALNVEVEKGEADDYVHYRYHYQSGNFFINIPTDEKLGISLCFPGVLTVEMDCLGLIRSVANKINTLSSPLTAYYSNNSADNEVILHFSTTLPHSTDVCLLTALLRHGMESCFNMHLWLLEWWTDEQKRWKKDRLPDMEFQRICDERLHHMACERLMSHSAERLKYETVDALTHRPLRLAELLQRLDIISGSVRLVRLTLQRGDERQVVTAGNDIAAFILPSALIDMDAPQAGFLADDAVLTLRYARPTDELNPPCEHTVVLSFEKVNRTDTTLYYRISYLAPTDPIHRQGAHTAFEALSTPVSGTLLLGYDVQPARQLRAEYEYMWKDAHDKMNEGRMEELTEEQRWISCLEYSHAGYIYYWGQRYLRTERYYEALVALTDMWNIIADDYNQADDETKRIFTHVSFLLGLCCYKLDRPREAHYYLQNISDGDNVECATLFVKCLFRLKDPRTRQALSAYMETVNNVMADAENDGVELESNFIEFRNFLRRQQISLDIEERYFDAAEAACREMLDEPQNSDFALNELEYIRQLRIQSSENDK